MRSTALKTPRMPACWESSQQEAAKETGCWTDRSPSQTFKLLSSVRVDWGNEVQGISKSFFSLCKPPWIQEGCWQDRDPTWGGELSWESQALPCPGRLSWECSLQAVPLKHLNCNHFLQTPTLPCGSLPSGACLSKHTDSFDEADRVRYFPEFKPHQFTGISPAISVETL